MTAFLKDILLGINGLVRNYGWSIVLFTLLIRTIIIPFDYKSRVSMRQTAKVQPKINALQKKYANDREKLNIKLNELYRKEHINPLSSCLPLLLTMPILFAMFAAMREAANDEVARQVLDMLQGNQPVMENWLWIKNLWMPDSPFAGSMPDLNTLVNQLPGDTWRYLFQPDVVNNLIANLNDAVAAGVWNGAPLTETSLANINALIAQLSVDAPFANDSLRATLEAMYTVLQGHTAYANAGIDPNLRMNFLLFTLDVHKNWNGLFLLPLLAAGSQVLMTKISGNTNKQTDANGNPIKQPGGGFMTWFFPLFSLWICSSSTAAFSLYWVAANIIAMVETFAINKYLDAKEKNQSDIIVEEPRR